MYTLDKRNIDIVTQNSRQDILLIFCAMLAHMTSSIFFFGYVVLFFLFGASLILTSMGLRYRPTDVKPSEIPKRTFFILLDEDKYPGFRWLVRRWKKDYSTWSFFFFNIIFCPKSKLPDWYGIRRLELIHEFSHCGRGEFFLFGIAFFAAFQMIRASIVHYFIHHNPEHIYFFNFILIIFGIYVMIVGAQLIRRREFITDYIAYSKEGEPYIEKFVKTREIIYQRQKSSSGNNWYSPIRFLIRWHPSWTERLKFLEGSGDSTIRISVWLIISAFITAFVALQISQFMRVPRETVLTWLSGAGPSSFFKPYGMVMHFVFTLWLCWLMARSLPVMTRALWLCLVLAYAAGSAIAQFSLSYAEYILFDTDKYHIVHFIHPFGVSLVWAIACFVVVRIIGNRTVSILIITALFFLMYMIGLTSFGFFLTGYDHGILYSPYTSMIAFYSVVFVGIGITIGCIFAYFFDLSIRLLFWLTGKEP